MGVLHGEWYKDAYLANHLFFLLHIFAIICIHLMNSITQKITQWLVRYSIWLLKK